MVVWGLVVIPWAPTKASKYSTRAPLKGGAFFVCRALDVLGQRSKQTKAPNHKGRGQTKGRVEEEEKVMPVSMVGSSVPRRWGP